jgi:probable phosphoglycerate mutase
MPYTMKKTEKKPIYIIRHGDNPYDEKGISGGNDQPGLTDEGKEQAEDIAEDLKDKGVEYVITSDAVRAKQTAKIIAEATGAEMIVDKRLETQDIGNLAGEPEEDVKPVMKYINEHHPNIKLGQTGESFNEFRKRFEEGYKAQLKKNEGCVLAFVLHGDGEKMIRSDFGRDIEEYKRDGLGHGDMIELKPSKNNHWQIKK